MRVATWSAILATAELAILARGDVPTPTGTEAAAIAYLAVITTALAFVLWFGAVQTLGTAKAGLLVGFMPIAAVAVDAALNGRTPSTADLAGTALVAAGIVFGAVPATARALRRLRPAAGTAGDMTS
jgi:drug/metabolite transporter (DMT)-like permease